MSVINLANATKEIKTGADKRLLSDIAYERLKHAIHVGELRPGDPLYEIQLSESFEISRTPMREALQQLVLEGLATTMPNRGITVASPSLEDLLSVLHIRSLIDPEIARLVASSASDEVIKTLNESVKKMKAAADKDDRRAWATADHVFHESLSNACPNILLGKLALQMRSRTQLVATDSATSANRLCECTEEHLKVFNAIEDRDADAAKEAMAKHLVHLKESIFQRMSFM